MAAKKESRLSCRELDNLTERERGIYLDKRLKWLIGYAYDKSPVLKDRLDKAGISPLSVSGIRDLDQLPVLRKDDLIDLRKKNPPMGGLITVPVNELGRIYVSPGPIYDPHHLCDSYWERNVHVCESTGFNKSQIAINTWAYHLVPAGLIIDEAMRRAGVTVIPAGVGNTDLVIQMMRDLQATIFIGSTGFFMNIITRAEELGLDIKRDFNIKLASIGGEMGGGPIRTIVENKYGIPTRDCYGTAETGLLAYECEAKTGMHIAGEMIVEIIDPETGKPVEPGMPGEIVLTPIDEIYPVVRFGTGDLATITYEPCQCGRISPRISQILGRVGDAVRTRGMFVHPRQLQPCLAKFSEISTYQLAVTRAGHRDEMTLKVELQEPESTDRDSLTENLKSSVSEAVRIKLDHVEYVEKGTIPAEHKLVIDNRTY